VRSQLRAGYAASALGRALGLTCVGPDAVFTQVVPMNLARAGTLTFWTRAELPPDLPDGIVVVAQAPPTEVEVTGRTILVSRRPRYDFARALWALETEPGFMNPADQPSSIHPTVQIAPGAYIGKGVTIGAHTKVYPNAVIQDGAIIGERCVIKSCAVIGEEGFGFERDVDGTPLRILHIGRVVIGNDVEIGSLTTVCRGTLHETRIHDHVKIDDHVHIGHNAILGRGAIIAACAEIGAGVELERNSWVGPNVSTIERVVIGEGAVVGIGANVIRSVTPFSVVAGNPAKPLPPKSLQSKEKR
jgi:acyl-[acyl carrier protein]--UDP-N-acetylglucosamine O-acyltransferase